MSKAAANTAIGKNLERKNTSGVSVGCSNAEETDLKTEKLKKKGNSTSDQQQNDGSGFIHDVDIQKMSIREEDLQMIRKSLESSPEKNAKQISSNRYIVKKRTAPLGHIKQPKTLVVARAAPADAELKPIDYSGPPGPRYNQSGEIVPHSLVGSPEDFVLEAIKQHHIMPNSGSTQVLETTQKIIIKQIDSESMRKAPHPQIRMAINQENALLNWQKKMADRKRQQGYISKLLQKPMSQLIMHKDNEYRKIQEMRKLVDRAIPAVDYGKGYRVGSEFWNQHESFGDDLSGIKMTLTKTERGIPIEFEHIAKPTDILLETGVQPSFQGAAINTEKQWKRSEFLRDRYSQLEPVMRQLDPLKPEISGLQMIGQSYDKDILMTYQEFDNMDTDHSRKQEKNNEKADSKIEEYVDPLEQYPDIFPQPVVGPSIVFDEHLATWTGTSSKHCGEIGCVSRVLFESLSGERTTSHLKVHNNGTTAIYFHWRLVVTPPSFESLKTDNIQRFYFNNGEGVVLPGETKHFPFVFKSPNPGIFKETWQFLPEPVLLGGASLNVVLKGIATEDDVDNDVRNKILAELSTKEAEIAAKSIIDELIKAIRIPDRPPSTKDAYLTEEELFTRKNPSYQYDYEIILELKNFYLQLFPEESNPQQVWSLSLSDLKEGIVAVSEETAQEELLRDLGTVINRLCVIPVAPTQNQKYHVCYRLLQEVIDGLCSCSMKTRSVMDLPEIVMEPVVEVDASAAAQVQTTEIKDDKKGKGAKKNAAKEDSKPKGKPAKKDSKEKDRPKSKDVKGGKGKGTPSGSTPTKEVASSERDITIRTPPNAKAVPVDSLDQTTRHKYTEKMYPQVYNMICNALDNMSDLFQEINNMNLHPI